MPRNCGVLNKMPAYLWHVVFFFLIVEARLEATFRLTRGLQDKFTNPHCGNHIACTVAQCARYFARCETDACSVCVCDEQSPTYVASEGRCVKDEDIFPPIACFIAVSKLNHVTNSVPKYSTFAISTRNGQPYITANRISKKLDHETKYTGRSNQLWLYTTSKKLMNLRTLECLDFSDNSSVALRRCTADKNTTQMWHCKNDSPGFYGILDGYKSYLDFSGSDFYMGYDKPLFEWVPTRGSDRINSTVCDIPDTYKGCYRFTDGASLKRFNLKHCQGKPGSDCFGSYVISAPIFSGEGHDSDCSLVWHNSMFSVDDKPWREFWYYDSDLLYGGRKLQPGLEEIKFRVKIGKNRWAGALMKLELECRNYNPFSRNVTSENHCVLLKFDGVFNASLLEFPLPDQPTKTSDRRNPTTSRVSPSSKPESSKQGSRYKSAVIALSIVLALVLLLVIFASVIIYRRRNNTQTSAATSPGDVSAKPFCTMEENI